MANKTMHHLVIEDNNYEILDAKNRANIAAEYSASSTYKVGDVVLYNGQLYKCTTAITTAEAWTAAHWTAVTVGGELSSVKDGLIAMSTATASDVGKALKAKTVEDGKVTAWEFGDTGATTDIHVDGTSLVINTSVVDGNEVNF